MEKIYGKNAKLFKYSKDDIFLYSTYNDYKSFPFYQHICPKCKEQICYYCSRFVNEKDYFNEKGICCLKRRIKYLIHYDGNTYINPVEHRYSNTFRLSFIYFITPIISLLLSSLAIQRFLFYRLALKNREVKNGHIDRYINRLKKNNYEYLALINCGIIFILVIPLFFIYICFIFFILIISIPFKFIPLTFILGILFAKVSL